MKILTLVLIFLSTTSHAETVLVKEQDNYFLSSDYCEDLKVELLNFKFFATRYDKKWSSDIKIIESCENKRVSLNSILPETINKLLNSHPEYFGPNCWNSVLNANNFIQSIRFSTPQEFENSLQYFQCRAKDFSEQLAPGDVIRIFNKAGEDFHSFIYITPEFSFSKNGPAAQATYGIYKTTEIFNDYEIDSSCFIKADKRISSSCAEQIKFYDCQNMPINKYSPHLEGMLGLLTELEEKISFLLLNYRHFKSIEARATYAEQLTTQSNMFLLILENDLTNGKLNEEDFKEERLLVVRLESINQQLSYF